MMIPVSLAMEATVATAWDVLIDTQKWPQWGPSVRAVESTPRYLCAGSVGRVQAPLGVWLPFEVTEFEEGKSWAWKVAGVPTTTHAVENDPIGCKVTFGVPYLAAPYALICRAALKRIERLALDASTP